MENINVDFGKVIDKIRPMHAVNNGPAGSRVRGGSSTYSYFKEAGIPYARTHDAAGYSGYGGEYTVDVHRIFSNFDADVNDPNSYDFECTDRYLKDIESVGTKVFYRLGATIEHGKKRGTYPPKDFKKWAEICEHIIMHYTQGWADGFNMDIEYWEIWNEPDCKNRDGVSPTWQGDYDQFIDFFTVVLSYLKEKFPNLKIGGPAMCGLWETEFINKLLSTIKNKNIPLDFFSFHRYYPNPFATGDNILKAKAFLVDNGFNDTELILNEWNYVKGWVDDEWVYSLKSEKSLKGSSYTAATMCVGQEYKLDMLMYYDARPCGMNGMFDTTFLTPLKGYYPFKMFNELYKLKNCVQSSDNSEFVYNCAAVNENKAAIMVTYFNDDDNAEPQQIKINIDNFSSADGVTAKYYLLDENNDMALVREEIFTGDKYSSILTLPLYGSYLITLEK